MKNKIPYINYSKKVWLTFVLPITFDHWDKLAIQDVLILFLWRINCVAMFCFGYGNNDRSLIFGVYGPFKYIFSIANAGLAIWFMLLTKTRYHTGRGLHYQDDFNWSDLKDIPRMHLWSRYFISQIYLLLYFFEVTLMSAYVSFLIYVSVWHLYENMHKKKIALSGTG